jgi:hypothetical protein
MGRSGSLTAQGSVKEAVARKVDSIVLHFSPNAIESATVEELNELAEMEGIKVSLLMPMPVWDKHIPKLLFNSVKDNTQLPKQNISEYNSFNGDLYSDLKAINSRNLTIYEVGSVFCENDCRLESKGKPLYFDQSHLTITGSNELSPVFERIILNII